jgi:hypothetical protein
MERNLLILRMARLCKSARKPGVTHTGHTRQAKRWRTQGRLPVTMTGSVIPERSWDRDAMMRVSASRTGRALES